MIDSWNILFTEKFKGDLKKLERSGVNSFLQSLSFLKDGPKISNNKLKPMKGASKAFRWRKGSLRVIFRLLSNSKEILLLRAGERQSIYNKVISTTNKAAGRLEDLINDSKSTDESIEIAPIQETLELFPIIPDESECIIEEIFIDQADLHLLEVPTEYHDDLMICETIEEASKLKLPPNLLARIEDYITSPKHDHIGKIYSLDKVDGLEDIASQPLSKFLVKLDLQQELIVNKPFTSGPLLIRGGPGTGKTLINLARIRKIFDHEIGKTLFDNGPKTVAFVTFNKPLSQSAKEMYREISRDKDHSLVEFFTLDSCIYSYSNKFLTIASEDIQFKALVDSFRLILPEEFTASYLIEFKTNNNLKYIIEEFEFVIQDKNLNESTYIDSDGHRKGRKKKLSKKQKSLIWKLFTHWKNIITALNLTTFSGRRLNLLKSIYTKDITMKKFDYVFVDELQDLSIVSIQLLTNLVKDLKNLTFTADTAQSIYLKSPSWSNIHKDLKFNRGNSFILRLSYRMTKEISMAISPLRLNSGDAEKENDGINKALFSGPKPHWIDTFESNHFPETVNIIKGILSSNRINPNQIAVIVSVNKDAIEIQKLLNNNKIAAQIVNSKKPINIRGTHLHIMTTHAAKGLEFPFVIVPKITAGKYPNVMALKNCYSSEEKEEQKEKAKRLLYVALSRAARELWIISDENKPCELLNELTPTHWEKRR